MSWTDNEPCIQFMFTSFGVACQRLSVVKRGTLFPAIYHPEGKERFVSEKADSERTHKNNASCILLLCHTSLMLRRK